MDKLNEIGFADWNKKSLDELVQHLEREFAFSSSGTAKAIFTLIEYYHQTKHLHKPVVSGKLTDEEIWQWVEWIDKRCNFTDHQKDYVWFAIRQILKTNSECASGAVDKTVRGGSCLKSCSPSDWQNKCKENGCNTD